MKRMIFHIPFAIDPNRSSGTNIRPLKMLAAFKGLQYEVDVIKGNGAQRKKSIARIKAKLKAGDKYDFVYSESSTMPTLLTEKHHLPTYPFLDFSFFAFCKKHKIPVALFYRDIFWNFSSYSLKGIKALYTKSMYYYDLKQYNKLVDLFYLPSLKMQDYIPSKIKSKIDHLPPGGEKMETKVKQVSQDNIELFYVGGFINHYQMEELFKALINLPFTNITICTRKDEWEKAKQGNLGKYVSDIAPSRVKVYHKQSHELKELYEHADLALLFIKPSAYWEFASPVKLFEYISYQKPIIASEGTYPGDYVKTENVGWTIPYNTKAFETLLNSLQKDKSLITKMQENVALAAPKNTWEARAQKVVSQVNELGL